MHDQLSCQLLLSQLALVAAHILSGECACRHTPSLLLFVLLVFVLPHDLSHLRGGCGASHDVDTDLVE